MTNNARERIKSWFRSWLGLTEMDKTLASHEGKIQQANDRLTRRLQELDELTKIDIDAGYRSNCTVVLTGVYRGKGYVQFYDLSPDHFRHYVEMLRHERKENLVRHIDAPIGFRGHFEL